MGNNRARYPIDVVLGLEEFDERVSDFGIVVSAMPMTAASQGEVKNETLIDGESDSEWKKPASKEAV